MLIGLLSDAHGNPLGLLSAVRALRARGAQELYFLGDAIGYLPAAAEVVGILSDAGIHCQRGNHEAMLLGELPLDPQRDLVYQLGSVGVPVKEIVAGWPTRRELTADGRRILLVHGAPDAPLDGYVYPDADLSGWDGLGYDAIFMGNTHRPFVATVGDTLIANVGSCGLPRDHGDLAACATFDTMTGVCEILRVTIPTELVLAQYRTPIHPSVVDCLHRRIAEPVGTVL